LLFFVAHVNTLFVIYNMWKNCTVILHKKWSLSVICRVTTDFDKNLLCGWEFE